MLKTSLIQAGTLRRGFVLAAGMREHLAAVGPAGTAKTNATLEFFHDVGRSSCSIACTADTLSDGIVGSINPKILLEEGTMEFIPGPSLLNSEFVHLDEFADLSSEIQALVLGPLQPGPSGRRIFTRAGREMVLPLEMVVITGNSWPKREAVRDRFAIQVPIAPAPTEEVVLWALEQRGRAVLRQDQIWDSIQGLREASETVAIDPVLVAAIVLAAAEFKMTMRRVAQYVMKALKTNAALEGRRVAGFQDFAETLPYLVQASTTEEFEKARNWVLARIAHLQMDAKFAELKKLSNSLARRKFSSPMAEYHAWRELLIRAGELDPDGCSSPSDTRKFIENVNGKTEGFRQGVVNAALAEIQESLEKGGSAPSAPPLIPDPAE